MRMRRKDAQSRKCEEWRKKTRNVRRKQNRVNMEGERRGRVKQGSREGTMKER